MVRGVRDRIRALQEQRMRGGEGAGGEGEAKEVKTKVKVGTGTLFARMGAMGAMLCR